MDLKLNKLKEKEEITRIASNIYRFDMKVPRDIRYSILNEYRSIVIKDTKVKPLVEDMSLLTLYKQDA